MNVMDVPRASSEMYQWVRKKGKWHAAKSDDFNALEFSHLNPGDLLFWTGTYSTKHEGSVSHVMIYLGKDKTGKPLMFGSSDGRTYDGKPMWGVSLFDFKLPKPGSHAHFIGYSCIPNLTCG
jgi:cell wall-associated NlpC family hydrolase